MFPSGVLEVAWWWCSGLVFRMAMASVHILALGGASSSFNGSAPFVPGRGDREPPSEMKELSPCRPDPMELTRVSLHILIVPSLKVRLVSLRGGLFSTSSCKCALVSISLLVVWLKLVSYLRNTLYFSPVFFYFFVSWRLL